MFHQKKIMIPSILLFYNLSNLVRHLCQYLWIDPVVSTESSTEDAATVWGWTKLVGWMDSLYTNGLEFLGQYHIVCKLGHWTNCPLSDYQPSGSSCVKTSMQRNSILVPLLLSKLALALACYRSPQTVSGKGFWTRKHVLDDCIQKCRVLLIWTSIMWLQV